MVCFERCVEIQAKKERNSLRRRARLLKAGKDLGLASYLKRLPPLEHSHIATSPPLGVADSAPYLVAKCRF
jgi:hypothetical protein